MADMGSLRGRLQGDFRSNYAVSDLGSYLDAMQLHATNLGYRLDAERRETTATTTTTTTATTTTPTVPRKSAERSGHRHPSSGTNSSAGDEPDSAIDINDGPPSPYQRSPREARFAAPHENTSARRDRQQQQQQPQPSLPIVEIEEFLDDLHGTSRAPTPPPKARARGDSVRSSAVLPNNPHAHAATATTSLSPFLLSSGGDGTLLPGLPGRPPSARSLSEYSAMLHDSEGNAVVPRRVSSLRSLTKEGSYYSDHADADADADGDNGDARSTVGSLMGIRPPLSSSESDYYGGRFHAYDGRAVITTTITGGPRHDDDDDSTAASPPPPVHDARPGRSSSRLFGRKNSFSVPGRSTRPATAQGLRRSSSSGRNGGDANANGSNNLLLNVLSGPGAALAVPADRADAARHRAPSPSSSAQPKMTGALPSSTSTSTTAAAAPAHARKASAATSHSATTQSSSGPTSSKAGATGRASTSTAAAAAASSIRSSSSRVSSVLRRMTLWRPGGGSNSGNSSGGSFLGRNAAAVVVEDLEPDDIFGVSLKKSMQMASATVRTHHDGSKGSSRREFPRCVLMCVSFIKDNGGVRAPHIFGGEQLLLSHSPNPDGDNNNNGSSNNTLMQRVAALREGFRTAPHYGDGNIDWSRHDVYDAAELIVLFLQQLPRPLVAEAVAKRWIVMSKQATLPGSMGLRLDSCIDFWDEALLGVRGAARSLLKLLLNLWGDVADAAGDNDMTAERLAARLLNPLMHLPAGKYTTDFMLGLAFLIRKRSEYAVMLREGRKSHAAFKA